MRRLVAALALALVPSIASASTITISDVFDPADVFMTNQHTPPACTGTNLSGTINDVSSAGTCGSLTWTHVLAGFNVGSDTLVSATLTLLLYNEGDPSGQAFNVQIDVLSLLNQSLPGGSSVTSPFAFSLDVIGQLLAGSANVLLDVTKNGNHDFWFASSTLDAQWTTPQTQSAVPEPASMVLLTSGLIAVAGLVRQRRRNAQVRN